MARYHDSNLSSSAAASLSGPGFASQCHPANSESDLEGGGLVAQGRSALPQTLTGPPTLAVPTPSTVGSTSMPSPLYSGTGTGSAGGVQVRSSQRPVSPSQIASRITSPTQVTALLSSSYQRPSHATASGEGGAGAFETNVMDSSDSDVFARTRMDAAVNPPRCRTSASRRPVSVAGLSMCTVLVRWMNCSTCNDV